MSLSPRMPATGADFLSVHSAGTVNRGKARRFGPSRRISSVTVDASTEVEHLVITGAGGVRRVVVPSHGTILVVWGKQRPVVSGFSADGECLVPDLFESPSVKEFLRHSRMLD